MTVTAERHISIESTAPQKLGAYRARFRFERLPAAYCHPERIKALLPERLPTGFRDRLLQSKRLRHRLSGLLAKRLALPPLTLEDLATPEGRFAQLEGNALNDAIRRAGAIWQARNIRKIIRKEPLRQLLERLGREPYRAALGLTNLAPAHVVDQDKLDADNPDVDKLMAWVERDGLVAVNAWCREQPVALADRFRLKLPPSVDADDDRQDSHRDAGLIIVDRVVMALFADNRDQVNTPVKDDG